MPLPIRDIELTPNALRDWFFTGRKDKADLKVGIEWEKIGVYRENSRAIRYGGERGVEAIFEGLTGQYGWQTVTAGGHVIALKKNETSITLEPGGQIELSGWKAADLAENAAELHSHLREIKSVSEPLGIVWLGIGAQPISSVDEIEWVPKPRYAIMRRNLDGKGALTYSMMKETASVQISVDYVDETDAVEKLRLGMGLSPFLCAMLGNSPLENGRVSPYLSRRAHIWRHTAPERSGIIPVVFKNGFDFQAYTDYALSVPMLFIVRNEEWVPVNGHNFKQFIEKGYESHEATLADWELHLTGIFTEARLKKYVEIRSVDCQKTEVGLASAALLKGLFYDGQSRKKAWELIAPACQGNSPEIFRLAAEAPAKGLKTPWNGHTLLDIAQELLILAEEGLGKLGEKSGFQDERGYLNPLKELILERKISPAEALLEELKTRSILEACAL